MPLAFLSRGALPGTKRRWRDACTALEGFDKVRGVAEAAEFGDFAKGLYRRSDEVFGLCHSYSKKCGRNGFASAREEASLKCAARDGKMSRQNVDREVG